MPICSPLSDLSRVCASCGCSCLPTRKGLIVGDIQAELGIANSTLSHHLEKLKHEGLVGVRRDSNRLWYCAKEDVLEELLGVPLRRMLHTKRSGRPEGGFTESDF